MSLMQNIDSEVAQIQGVSFREYIDDGLMGDTICLPPNTIVNANRKEKNRTRLSIFAEKCIPWKILQGLCKKDLSELLLH